MNERANDRTFERTNERIGSDRIGIICVLDSAQKKAPNDNLLSCLQTYHHSKKSDNLKVFFFSLSSSSSFNHLELLIKQNNSYYGIENWRKKTHKLK